MITILQILKFIPIFSSQKKGAKYNFNTFQISKINQTIIFQNPYDCRNFHRKQLKLPLR